jgi:hypothetical protein
MPAPSGPDDSTLTPDGQGFGYRALEHRSVDRATGTLKTRSRWPFPARDLAPLAGGVPTRRPR